MRGLTRRTAVLNLVGLTPGLLGPSTPFLSRWMAGAAVASMRPPLPAVTCSAQATMLTGVDPSAHGIVGNGWYDRELSEIRFWRQSAKLVQAPYVWDAARKLDPGFTCANLFWWFAMYSNADITVTPRPMYPADGRKIPDVWTNPPELRDALQSALGRFPLFEFWGPRTSINASRWIAEAAKRVELSDVPSLSLVYIPHLDYVLQRAGPGDKAVDADLALLDALCADLIGFYQDRGVQVIVLSEYGIERASRPVYLNRALRRHGLLSIRDEMGHDMLDPGASAAFAVVDHQVAHIHVRDPAQLESVRAVLAAEPGVEAVLDQAGKREAGIDHPRAGDLVAVAEPGAWFCYYFWDDDRRAPDFARTVDIHRKPGYDPAELFINPALRFPGVKAASILTRKKMGFRTLMDLIPLDATMVRGSHGRRTTDRADSPLVATQSTGLLTESFIEATAMHGLILEHLFGPDNARSGIRVRDYAEGD